MAVYQSLYLLILAFLCHATSEENSTDLLNSIELYNPESYDLLESVDPYIPVPYPITNWCYAWLQQFSLVSSDFVRCSVNYARPFRFCRNCAEEYLKARNFMVDLKRQDAKLNVSKRCFPKLINSDIINIVGKVNDFIQAMWTDSFCDNCYDHYDLQNGTIDFELSNFTERFEIEYNRTKTCMDEFILYENSTIHYDSYGCLQCQENYTSLNRLYMTIKENGSACMDVTDAMNYTRYLWSKDFQCNIQAVNEIQVLGTSAAIFTLPIIFYIISKFQGAIRKKRLLKLKRLNLKRGTAAHAGLLRSASLVYSDNLHQVPGQPGRRQSEIGDIDARRLNITPTSPIDNHPAMDF